MESGGGERKQEWEEGRPLCLCALAFPLPALCPNCPHLQLPGGFTEMYDAISGAPASSEGNWKGAGGGGFMSGKGSFAHLASQS